MFEIVRKTIQFIERNVVVRNDAEFEARLAICAETAGRTSQVMVIFYPSTMAVLCASWITRLLLTRRRRLAMLRESMLRLVTLKTADSTRSGRLVCSAMPCDNVRRSSLLQRRRANWWFEGRQDGRARALCVLERIHFV
jgi:hypothetical protein